MTAIRLLPEAREELAAAAIHYESHQAGLGTALLAEVRRAVDRIGRLPLAARSMRGGLRRRAVRRFPYYLICRVTDDEILIIAFAHRRRRPGYWRGRV